MLLKPSPVSTRKLTVSDIGTSTTRVMLVGEASDLPKFERVWDDACDVGLTLVSHKTGREVVFVVAGSHRDREGELQYWDLVPAEVGDEINVVVRIFND